MVVDKLAPIIEETTSLRRAVQKLISTGRSYALVVDGEGSPIGTLGVRDALRALVVEAEEGIELLEYPDLSEALENTVRRYMDQHIIKAGPLEPPERLAYLMVSEDVGCIALVEDDRLKGAVTEESLARFASGIREVSVGDIMSYPVHSIEPEAMLLEAAGVMLQHGFRRLLVLGEGTGIITALDILREVVKPGSLEKMRRGENPLETPVSEYVLEPVYLEPETPLQAAVDVILDNPARCALVGQPGIHPRGIVTARDLVRAVAGIGK